jgi:hypothetical protein
MYGVPTSHAAIDSSFRLDVLTVFLYKGQIHGKTTVLGGGFGIMFNSSLDTSLSSAIELPTVDLKDLEKNMGFYVVSSPE